MLAIFHKCALNIYTLTGGPQRNGKRGTKEGKKEYKLVTTRQGIELRPSDSPGGPGGPINVSEFVPRLSTNG